MLNVVVCGNVGQDGRLGHAGETSVLNFTMASRSWENGAVVTTWCDVAVWGKRALQLNDLIKTGAKVCVRGAARLREYEHKGQKRTTLTIRADDVELISKPQRDESAPRASSNGEHDDMDAPF